MENLKEKNLENSPVKNGNIFQRVQKAPMAGEITPSTELIAQDESETPDKEEVAENFNADDAFVNDSTAKKDQTELYLYLNLVIKLVMIFSRLKLTPLTWNKKRKKMQITDSWFHYFFWVNCVQVLTVTGIYGTWRLLKEVFDPTPTFEGYKLLVYGLYYLLILMFLIYDYTLIFKARESVQLFNAYIAVEFALADVLIAKGRRFEAQDLKDYKQFKRLLLYMTICSATGTSLVPLSSALATTDVDPLRRFVMEHFPPEFIDSPWIIGALVLTFYLVGFHALGIVFIGCMSSMAFTIRLNHYLKFVLLEDKHALLHNDALSAIKMHTYMQFILGTINHWGEYLAPLLLLIGNVIHTLTIYSSIMLYDVIPMPGYLYFPFFSINVAIFELVILPMAASLFERSVKAQHLWYSKPLEKWVAKKTRTMFPFGLKGGMFFMIKRETATTFFSTAVNNTIDLIMGVTI